MRVPVTHPADAGPPRADPPPWPRTGGVFRTLRDRGDPFAGTDLDASRVEFFPGRPLTEDDVLDLTAAAEDPWPPEAPEPEAEPPPGAPEPEATPKPALPDETWEYRDADVIWFTPPPTLDGLVQYGAVHTDAQCPVFVFRALDERSGVCLGELAGSNEGMQELAEFIARHTRAIACMARGINGPQPLRGPMGKLSP